MGLSWAILGPRQPKTGPRQPQDSPRQIRDRPKTAPKTPPRRPRSILYCFLQGFWSVEKKCSKNIAKNRSGSPWGDPVRFFAMIFELCFRKGLGPSWQPRAPRRGSRAILCCFLQGFLRAEQKVFKIHCKKQTGSNGQIGLLVF